MTIATKVAGTCLAILLPSMAFAGLDNINIFVSGDEISAKEMNQNFSELRSAHEKLIIEHESLLARVTTLELGKSVKALDTRVTAIEAISPVGYLTKSNTYRDISEIKDIPDETTTGATISCRDNNDLPLTVDCIPTDARIPLTQINNYDWNNPEAPASSRCEFYNNITAGIGARTAITCVAIP